MLCGQTSQRGLILNLVQVEHTSTAALLDLNRASGNKAGEESSNGNVEELHFDDDNEFD